MEEPVLRPAGVADLDVIEAIVRDAYGKYVARIGKRPAPMSADYGRLIADGDVWVLECGNDVAGLMVLRPAADHLLIGNVAVSPAFQGRGLGRKLLAFAEGRARQLDLLEMRLFTNEAMHENIVIYRKLGWTEYERTESDGFRRVFMKKRLPRDTSS